MARNAGVRELWSRCQWQRLRQICTPALAAAVIAACATSSPPGGDPDAGAPPDGRVPFADAAPGADADPGPPDGAVTSSKRIVILMVGDGMGPGQLEAASHYAHGSAGQLFMESLPVRGKIRTASLSGITDSAAAATTMATGAVTYNARIGLDRDGAPRESLVEAAHRVGLSAGVVTTSSLPHATPAAFTAHHPSRHDYVDIADDQALETRAEVMLGGGMRFFAPAGPGSDRSDGGLLAPLESAGYQVVTTAAELAAAPGGAPLVGLFAPEHLTYVADRTASTTEPTLSEMALAALDRLDDDPDGFFLLVEGARIDMASHGNDALRAITEAIAFDDAVRAVAQWADGRDDVTLVVTADHECGGLEVITGYGPGQIPDVAWRWGNHTNATVDLFARGPGVDLLDSETRSFAWLHAALRARVEDSAVVPPLATIIPDGDFSDLRHLAASQVATSGFGPGFNQLDSLRVDADAGGLAIGIAGAFEWDANAVVLMLDVDAGAGTGHAALAGALADTSGRADSILSALNLTAPPMSGFGADFAVVVWGGADPHVEDLVPDAGLRGLVAPVGSPTDLGWYGTAINFADGVRARTTAVTPRTDGGLELYIPWTALYPTLAGKLPIGGELAIAAVLVNDDGGYTSNQALPPFPAGTDNPGRTPTALPAVVRFDADADDDGTADGDAVPSIP